MTTAAIRVVFLTGGDSRPTRMSVESVCAIEGVVPVAVLVDTFSNTFWRRLQNLRRNLRRNGWKYICHVILQALCRYTDDLADRAVLRPGEVDQLLQRSFPERCHGLEDIGTKYNFEVREVKNLNGAEALAALKQCDADLGIVLGTRILKPATFTIPKMGCINLHKGKVPEYRGMPPGFWELYDREDKAGVTVHFVNSKLDAGDVVETSEIAILPRDTPETVLEKLHQLGNRTLVHAVTAIRNGTYRRKPQPITDIQVRTMPTMRQMKELRQRLSHWKERSTGRAIVKNVLYLCFYWSGVYSMVSRLHRRSRAAIILYHRVNDFSCDVLSVSTRSFASQMLVISKHYNVMRSSDLVERLCGQREFSPTTVLIHFDDAYRDVYTNGQPILKALSIPATAFIASGYVNTMRSFEHDHNYAFKYENCRTLDLREWVTDGFEIGAHTVNHVDLGSCSLDDAKREICSSGADLTRMIGVRSRLFSYPFGGTHNIRQETRDLIGEAGYDAIFSAYGGFVGDQTSRWDIPRFGVSSMHKPLWLLMEIEGLAAERVPRICKSLFDKVKDTIIKRSLDFALQRQNRQ